MSDFPWRSVSEDPSATLTLERPAPILPREDTCTECGMAFPGSEDLVAAAEAALGRPLPEAHRSRLIRENGGEVESAGEIWTLYPVWDDTDRKTVARTTSHILRENHAIRREWPDAMPPGFVAIADNGGGDMLVLRADEDDVLYWDHETGRLTGVAVHWDGISAARQTPTRRRRPA